MLGLRACASRVSTLPLGPFQALGSRVCLPVWHGNSTPQTESLPSYHGIIRDCINPLPITQDKISLSPNSISISLPPLVSCLGGSFSSFGPRNPPDGSTPRTGYFAFIQLSSLQCPGRCMGPEGPGWGTGIALSRCCCTKYLVPSKTHTQYRNSHAYRLAKPDVEAYRGTAGGPNALSLQPAGGLALFLWVHSFLHIYKPSAPLHVAPRPVPRFAFSNSKGLTVSSFDRDIRDAMSETKKSEVGVESPDVSVGVSRDMHDLEVLGYKPEMKRNRTMFTLLFQSLAIAAVGFDQVLVCSRVADSCRRFRTASDRPSLQPSTEEVSLLAAQS